jgi:hypothetical protein
MVRYKKAKLVITILALIAKFGALRRGYSENNESFWQAYIY